MSLPQILQHLNLWERPQRSPPPRLFPHKLETLANRELSEPLALIRDESLSGIAA